jgi:hypothetical protein
MAAGRTADDGAVGKPRLSGAAAGPAPWTALAGLVAAATALAWVAAPAGTVAGGVVAMAAIAGFWLIVPKGSSSPKLPRWIPLAMAPAFIVLMFIPALYGLLDASLIGIGYAVGFILWLQVGLWLAERFEPIHDVRRLEPIRPAQWTGRQKLGVVILVVAVAGLFAALVNGVSERANDIDVDQRASSVGSNAAYPPAASTAGPMTPEWIEYAAAIDRACAQNYNWTLARQQQVEVQAAQQSWSNAKQLAAIQALWADNQQALAADVGSMGEPPEKPDLLRRWLGNVERRGALFATMAAANRRGKPKLAVAAWQRIDRLKREADLLGRGFGLRICTSN